jgi:flagellar protein FliS
MDKRGILNATPQELLIVSYELCIANLEKALYMPKSEVFLKKAQAIVNQLICVLDFRYEISKDLYYIYEYVSRQLLKCLINFDKALIEDCRGILCALLASWKEAVKKRPYLPKADVFVGLTYNKTQLCEYIDQDSSSGFQV